MNHYLHKYFIRISALLLLLNIELNAQVQIGIKGGLNITRNTVANQYVQPNISNKTGFTVGAIVNYSISSIFSIQSELVYNQRGLEKKRKNV